MNHDPDAKVDLASGRMRGGQVVETIKHISELRGVFQDAAACRAMPPDQIVYRVQYLQAVQEGMQGGLFWGSTTIEPGKVGDEFFMTKGHFHAVRNRGEYYLGAEGVGALLLMDESGNTEMQNMAPGTLHYIPGHTAHRVVNTGEFPLTFLACWPSDAGHDYATIEQTGFTGRVVDVNGRPEFITR